MKKTKRTLVSMIVFLTIFCLPAIFTMQRSSSNGEGPTKEKDVVATEADTFTGGIQDIEVQPFSYKMNSIDTFGDEQSFTLNDTPMDQAETMNEQKEYSYTRDADTSEEVAKDALTTNATTSNSAALPVTQVAEITAFAITDAGNETAVEEEIKEETTKQEKALYSNIGISIASSFVNIREEATTDSEILGKLYKNAAAEILDTKGDWYYIESGSIKGYAKSEFIKTGLSDDELIDNYSELRATVDVDGLNVREKPDTQSDKVTVVYLNETYPVVELKDDWIKINVAEDHVTGYVKKEYADLLIDFKKAISTEEEKELLRLEAEERAKKETEVKYEESVSYSNSDLELLACLVHSEAGTQSYEGKLAVANVVLNRVASSKYPDSIKAVIYQSGQFSVAASGSLAKQLGNYDNYSSTSQKLSIKAAKAALSGANNIGTRLYFHSYKAALKKGYDNKSSSVKLGDHLFW
jgi:spore germination cell wall hydrolase CwlJ-like protein